MAETTLEQVARLAHQLSSEDQRLLAMKLLQEVDQQAEMYRPRAERTKEEIRRTLDEAWGILDTGKTIDEIDQEIREMRDRDWSRDWDKES